MTQKDPTVAGRVQTELWLWLVCCSHQFDDMELDTRDTCTAAIRMFKDMNMIKKFRIPYEVSVAAVNVCTYVCVLYHVF